MDRSWEQAHPRTRSEIQRIELLEHFGDAGADLVTLAAQVGELARSALGFRETRDTGTLAIRNTRDFFKNQNDTSIVIEMPRSAVVNNNQPLDIWATTARFGGNL